MFLSRWFVTGVLACMAVGTASQVVRGEVFRDVALGLGYAGFDIEGDENLLSGGVDFLISNNFVGNPLDFGVWDLTVQGPLSLEVSTADRGLSQFDISLQTALSGGATAQPLGYLLDYDVGGQAMQVSGSLLLDADLSLNGFGFYDLQFTYSSRQEVAREGRFTDDASQFDFDVGPVSISGNIFADLLAMVTAPFFEQSGYANPFESFSGRSQLKEVLQASAAHTQSLLAAGGDPASDGIAILDIEPAAGGLPAVGDPLPMANLAEISDRDFTGGTVPEPTVLVLMLLSLPAVLIRRRCGTGFQPVKHG